MMSDLSDMSRFGDPVSLRTLLSAGVGEVGSSASGGAAEAGVPDHFLLVGFGAIFLPILAVRRGRGERAAMPEVAGGVSFAITLVLVYSFALPAIGISSLRSFPALLPLCAVLIVAGVRWASGESRMAMWVYGATLLFYFVSGALEDRRSVAELNMEGERERAVGTLLRAHGVAPGGGGVIMTKTRHSSLRRQGTRRSRCRRTGCMAARAAADLLRVTHVVIDTDRPPGSMEEVRSALKPADVPRFRGHTCCC